MVIVPVSVLTSMVSPEETPRRSANEGCISAGEPQIAAFVGSGSSSSQTDEACSASPAPTGA